MNRSGIFNPHPFVADLLQPLHAEPLRWERRSPRRDEQSLSGGVNLQCAAFPEEQLSSAVDDFARFLQSAGISSEGEYPLVLRRGRVAGPESYRLRVTPLGCEVQAEDLEGVRRALIFIEDEMQRRGAPVLPLGSIERRPFLRTRIHSGHLALVPSGKASMLTLPGGPGAKPARHDLARGLPDAYLQRIVHDGANALWSTLDALGYHGRLVPEYDQDPEPFLERTRNLVARYARFGLRLFLYHLVPEAIPGGHPLLARYPDVQGHASFNYFHYCTSSAIGQRLLEQAMARLFRDIPGLGGYIIICVGERPTHCASGAGGNMNCPRCRSRRASEVLADTLAAMERGIHRANPDAELIAWPYMQNVCWGERLTRDAAGRIPPGVILQHNFENAGHAVQLGKPRRADDYWLSYTGPADLFSACARRARRAGTPVYAKAMVAGSHELASVPYIPAPGLVYRKIAAMRKLGVTGILANWLSSNDPSLMQRAAGELAFEPFPESEDAFLLRHARRDWGHYAPTVVRAWKWFARGYSQYPLTIGFSYYGPMHNGVVWELNLVPRDIHLPRSWKPDEPVGDRIGDCTGYHTLGEIITLCRRMRDGWSRGVRILETLQPQAQRNRERQEQLAVAQALELHFISGVNILEFYKLREDLAWQRARAPLQALARMRALVRAEIETDRRLLPLVKAWPRLGYTPEAGVYKVDSALIRRRMAQLRRLLRTEFPAVEQRLRAGREPFPHYTGNEPRGAVARAFPGGDPGPDDWKKAPPAGRFSAGTPRTPGRNTRWRARYDDEALLLRFDCLEPHMDQLSMNGRDREGFSHDDRIWINIETSPFDPLRRFMVNPAGARDFRMTRGMNVNPPLIYSEPGAYFRQDVFFQWTVRIERNSDAWHAVVRIPWTALGGKRPPRRPLRINVGRDAGPAHAREQSAWVSFLPERRRAEFGWLVLMPRER